MCAKTGVHRGTLRSIPPAVHLIRFRRALLFTTGTVDSFNSTL
jgi:hypothetical protein